MNFVRNQEWNRDELVLTLDLYMRCGGRIPNARDPEVIALSSQLAELTMLEDDAEARTGRSRAAIIYKMSNFRALDPKAGATGKIGFSHVGSLDKVIWQEFADNPDELKRGAESIRQKIRAGQEELEPLRANLHILRLLGDELIGSHLLAIFELVKNSYDADASMVMVQMELESNSPAIIVMDDGCGMSLETIKKGWLQIGTPLKRRGKIERTPRFRRLPLGEKGVGRLAAFKLGDRLEMTTREEGGTEYNLVMDLQSILIGGDGTEENSVEDVRVRVQPLSKPVTFPGENHGTLIKISKLSPELVWSKREIRELQRLVNSLSSPFQKIGEFETLLLVPGRENDLDTLPDIKTALENALWIYKFTLNENGDFRWEFQFNPPAVFRGLERRELKAKPGEIGALSSRLEFSPYESEPDMPVRSPKRLFVIGEDLAGIGPIKGEFYVFDLRGEVLKHLGTRNIKMMLERQGGIRVYRDRVRVFNYGEPGNDWLELNIERVNKPGKTLATNSAFAAIYISLNKSTGLREKTNREGFDENDTYKTFRMIVHSLVEHLNTLRQPDRDNLKRILKGDPIKEDAPTRFRKSMDEILSIAKDKGVLDQISKPIERVRKEYETLQEVVVSSGAGLNLAIVFHEVEREARGIAEGLKKGEDLETLKIRAESLVTILDGFGSLLRKASRKTMPVSVLVKRALQLSQGRFKAHKIVCSCPVLTGEDEDFTISGAINFYFQSLTNLIDNAIYWVRRRAELEDSDFHGAIQIRTLPTWAAEGPSLAVLDNGSGFSITPEEAMRPFASTRPGGMGLGLYFARTAMEANGGDLLIPESIEDLDIKTNLDGGAVVMRFRRPS